MTVKTEYLVDRKGHKKSVVMSVKSYKKLLEHIEDLEDSLDLIKAYDTAKKSKEKSIPFFQAIKEIKRLRK